MREWRPLREQEARFEFRALYAALTTDRALATLCRRLALPTLLCRRLAAVSPVHATHAAIGPTQPAHWADARRERGGGLLPRPHPPLQYERSDALPVPAGRLRWHDAALPGRHAPGLRELLHGRQGRRLAVH